MNLKTNPPGRASACRLRCRAFTLVEIMIAFAIFSMLVAAIYSTWTLLLRSQQVGTEAAARTQRQRIAVATLEEAITCAQSYQASLGLYYFAVTNGEQPALSFVARLPGAFPRNDRFGKDFSTRRLTFTLEPGKKDPSEKVLALRQNPILMEMDSDEKAFPLELMHHLQKFIVECWDTNKAEWVDAWLNTNSIPPLLRITLVSEGATANSYNDRSSDLVITRVVATQSQMTPSFLQTQRAGGGGGGGINLRPGNSQGNNQGNNPRNNSRRGP